ncbi:alpha-ketoglutarate dehydrogenase component 4 [Brachyhypopomus gauderio]|uniref:alpha-ketoglutarate dehydrogenase component 4 n=1 Tax=Brachyhypopomus gauderio TaxID=698409 RepID=UPI00404196E9
MGSKVSSGKMAVAARVVQIVRPHVPLIKFPNRQGLTKPNVQETLELLMANVPQTFTPTPAQAATVVAKAPRAAERLPGTPDSVAIVKDLPQKYRRRPLGLEEIDHIQRGGPE